MRIENLAQATELNARLEKLSVTLDAFANSSGIVVSAAWCGERVSAERLIDRNKIRDAVVALLSAEIDNVQQMLRNIGIEL